MKPYCLRPRARGDRRTEVQYYRLEAGTKVATKLVEAMAKALASLAINPNIGPPALGKEMGVEGLRTWRVDDFPLSFWYFDRDDCIDVVRLVGQRQDQGDMLIEG